MKCRPQINDSGQLLSGKASWNKPTLRTDILDEMLIKARLRLRLNAKIWQEVHIFNPLFGHHERAQDRVCWNNDESAIVQSSHVIKTILITITNWTEKAYMNLFPVCQDRGNSVTYCHGPKMQAAPLEYTRFS